MRFRKLGIENPYTLPSDEFIGLVLGEMLDGRPKESVRDKDGKITQLGQDDLLAMLNGQASPDGTVSDQALAEAYAEAGADPITGQAMDPLKVRMFQEMRNATSPAARASIRARYADLAAERRQAAK